MAGLDDDRLAVQAGDKKRNRAGQDRAMSGTPAAFMPLNRFPRLLPVLRPSESNIVIYPDYPARLEFNALKQTGRGLDRK